MAIRTATAAQSGVQPKGLQVGLVAVHSTYSFDTSISAGDVIQMCKVPARAKPIFIQYGTTTTSGFLMFELGDGIDTDRYRAMASLSAGQQMIVAAIPVAPYVYSQDDTIDILMSLATVVSLTGGFAVNVIFSMDPGP